MTQNLRSYFEISWRYKIYAGSNILYMSNKFFQIIIHQMILTLLNNKPAMELSANVKVIEK